MYTPTSKLLEEGTHSLPAYTGPDGQSAEWRDPWDGQLPLPISLAPKTFQMWNEQDFTWNLKKWTTKLIFKIFIDLIVTATIGENLFFPLISKHLLVWKDSYKKKKKMTMESHRTNLRTAWCPLLSIHDSEMDGKRVRGQPHQRRQREDQGKNWQSLLFHSEWMELGHWWQ